MWPSASPILPASGVMSRPVWRSPGLPAIRPMTAPIIGSRNLEQLNGSLKALEIEMTPELRAEISALSPEPPPATDRNDERTMFNYGAR